MARVQGIEAHVVFIENYYYSCYFDIQKGGFLILMATQVSEVESDGIMLESVDTLIRHVENLEKHIDICRKGFSAFAARAVCEDSGHVWDTIEGLLHQGIAVDQNLLNRAFLAISTAINVVSQMEAPPQTARNITKQVSVFIASMTSRRDELEILRKFGRRAFFDYLRTRLS